MYSFDLRRRLEPYETKSIRTEQTYNDRNIHMKSCVSSERNNATEEAHLETAQQYFKFANAWNQTHELVRLSHNITIYALLSFNLIFLTALKDTMCDSLESSVSILWTLEIQRTNKRLLMNSYGLF